VLIWRLSVSSSGGLQYPCWLSGVATVLLLYLPCISTDARWLSSALARNHGPAAFSEFLDSRWRVTLLQEPGRRDRAAEAAWVLVCGIGLEGGGGKIADRPAGANIPRKIFATFPPSLVLWGGRWGVLR
jgi:hypothetical protein